VFPVVFQESFGAFLISRRPSSVFWNGLAKAGLYAVRRHRSRRADAKNLVNATTEHSRMIHVPDKCTARKFVIGSMGSC
jgi:hypothetical protein